jgi:nucleotide-binding universal stress UspA family protein
VISVFSVVKKSFMYPGMTQPFAGYRRILLPTQFTAHCERTAMQAAWLAQQSGGTLHLVHVVENPLDPVYKPEAVQHWVVVEHANTVAKEMLEAEARRCVPPGVPSELHVLSGVPADKLVALAQSIGADLIVMSTHASTSLSHLLLGDTAEKVSRHAPCPVLLVHVPL